MPDLVIKIGGGLLKTAGDLDYVLRALSTLACSRRPLVVPGGGPFADAVRAVGGQIGLSDDAAHWMAVLAMDQYAHLVATRLEKGVIVWSLEEARRALRTNQIPVLAPSRWLHEEDPLPHSWDVTSDSVSAWIAGASGAQDLVLVKPRGANGDLIDSYFARVVPAHLRTTIVPVEQVAAAFREMTAKFHPDAT